MTIKFTKKDSRPLVDLEDVGKISGVEFQYYHVCHTQLWLYSHQIIKANEDENVKIGRKMHEKGYGRLKRELSINRSKLDVSKLSREHIIVYERKKSKLLEAHEMQLKFYLYQLWVQGLEARGILVAKGHRKLVFLKKRDVDLIKSTLPKIIAIKNLPNPPKPTKKPVCKNCAYREFCFGDEYE